MPARLTPNMTPIGPLGPWTPFRAERRIISPEEAQELVDGSERKNRSGGKAEIIARAIKLGHWKFTGTSIIFDINGDILDGHNRLKACMLADQPIDVLIVFGLPPDVFDAIDIDSRPRKISDVFDIEGHSNYVQIASASSLILSYLSGVRSNEIMGGSLQIDATTRRAYAVACLNRGLQQSIRTIRNNKGFWFLTDRVAIAMHFLFGQADWKLRDKFFESLGTGANLSPGDPVLAIRNRLMNTHIRKRGEKEMEHQGEKESLYLQLNALIRTWNAFVHDKPMKQLTIPTKVGKSGRIVPADLPEIDRLKLTIHELAVHVTPEDVPQQ